jgi:hypothetical protein
MEGLPQLRFGPKPGKEKTLSGLHGQSLPANCAIPCQTFRPRQAGVYFTFQLEP